MGAHPCGGGPTPAGARLMNGYWLGVLTPFAIVLGILLLWLAGSLFAAIVSWAWKQAHYRLLKKVCVKDTTDTTPTRGQSNTVRTCSWTIRRNTGKPDESGKMNKQNEASLLERLADTFETKLREAERSIGTDIPGPYREGRMDAFGWAATYCRLLAERESPTTPDASGWSKSAYLRTAPSSTCTTRTANR